ncbi:SseB family protein [Leucobacter sp. UT-8R-CII-1-4]|uniref:SseB family protein n=1 Tax=Leucobacter sp. UT-8R-CII-1-4 TaxID=3040075 RepID=UPI0024A89844|nr:SseB family protein [Leucobacter sp. UT-8R-CII-1-4]MDI6022925.1 SseB family protein [Leucobacter sp. UT-8R-CII-1-4]
MAIEKLPSTGDVPRSTGVPASLVPGGAADSAGFPWAGRTFDHHETAFAGDDGATPEALRVAVAKLRETAASLGRGERSIEEALDELAAAHTAALLALGGSRVLIPLLAEAGDLGLTPEGKVVEKTQELSIVTIGGPDGRKVLPVFSSVETMRAWNPEARPIPVPMPQAAVAAAQEQTDLIIVDPGTPEAELGVRRTQLEAVALLQEAPIAWHDQAVLAAFAESVSGEPRVDSIALVPADPQARLLAPELDVVLTLQSGLDQASLAEVIALVQQRWAASPVIAAGVDSLRLRVM